MESGIDDRKSLNDFLDEADLQQYQELFRDVLKVTKLSQLKFVASEDLVQIGLSKPEQRRYKKIYSKYFPSYMSKIKKLLSSNKRNESNFLGHYSLPNDFQPFPENSVKVPTKHIISIEDITLNQELGMGQFGVVQLGTWTTGNQRVQVAIKCLGHERMTSNSTEFLKEAAVMHSIEHPNIVRLFGVVLHLDTLMLVTELAPLRSLLECLREVSLRVDFAVPNLCEFAEQICDGMAYLEHKRLIHRDLAARNILVFSKDRVKISDFGLSRALGVGKDYYRTNYNMNLKLPVAWCAPECILFLRFTSASDVWAFGVCLWEMFTYGFQPWAALSGQQILDAIDVPNFQRLERPECCPQDYYTTMLECWSHDPNKRPKFKELVPRLRCIRPDQVRCIVQATSNFERHDEVRRSNFLEYKVGQIITVLGREGMTKNPYWYGVLPGGACGLLDPNHVKPFVAERSVSVMSTLSSHPTRHSSRSLRSSLLRSDVKRHTYTGKRSIQRSMISSPQGDFKHTGHVGLDGAYFGDISFLDPAGCPPRQVVSPYKASEDMDQVPLINPNSPTHLIGASGTSPFTIMVTHNLDPEDEVDLPTCEESVPLKKHPYKSSEVTATKIFNKVKNVVPKSEGEIHEYHEISDTDTESASFGKPAPVASKGEGDKAKSTTDFSQSLLDEMESIFRNFETQQRDEPITQLKASQETGGARAVGKSDKKKGAGTMKPMSAHDEKTLNTAVALANEITSKSMNDLNSGNKKQPRSSNDYRSKFHFKLPLTLHHGPHPLDPDKDKDGKPERRNFSDEAKSVPDIQGSLTAESKHAYISLIEEPTSSTSLMSQLRSSESTGILKTTTIPKSLQIHSQVQFRSLQKQTPNTSRVPKPTATRKEDKKAPTENKKKIEPEKPNNRPVNVLPLPPRGTKPPQIDMRRHVRKHPLLEPGAVFDVNYKPPVPSSATKPLIYQNTKDKNTQTSSTDGGVDVVDGNKVSAPSNAAPVVAPRPGTSVDTPKPTDGYYVSPEDYEPDIYVDSDLDDDERALALIKYCEDQRKRAVSVEDLLEFADQKPCGRQRGMESDEVRVMNKVMNNQVNLEECLQALEVSKWNVHLAIKMLRVKLAVVAEVTFEECKAALDAADGDTLRASANLVMEKRN